MLSPSHQFQYGSLHDQQHGGLEVILTTSIIRNISLSLFRTHSFPSLRGPIIPAVAQRQLLDLIPFRPQISWQPLTATAQPCCRQFPPQPLTLT